MSLRRFYPPCFLSIGAEDHDTWLPPERMYLEHLSDNHIPKAGIGHLLDRPVEIRWWHLLADPDRMTCQGQDRCCRYTPSTAYLETATDKFRMRQDQSIDAELAMRFVAEGAGTQFHPLMKEAMEDPSLTQRITSILDRGRKAAYIRIYRQKGQDE